MKYATSFSNTSMRENCPKIKKASQRFKRFGKTAIIANGCPARGHTSGRLVSPPCLCGCALVECSLHTSLAQPADHPSTVCGLVGLVP